MSQLYDKDGNLIDIDGNVNIVRQQTSGVPIAQINDVQLFAPQGGGGAASYDTIGYPVLNNNNPLAMLITGASRARLFRTWGIIGASFETDYTECMDGNQATYMNDNGVTWPSLFASVNGVEVGNFAKAGTPLYSWLNSDTGWGALDAATPKQAYIINMSTNDASLSKYSQPVGDITTDIDYNDYTQNAATWVGTLATIIQKLRIKSPRCYIFMATMRNIPSYINQRTEDMCQAIRDICTCFDHVFLIDMLLYGVDWSNTAFKREFVCGSHPNRNGHIYLADAFNTFIDWVIRTHPVGMRDAAFIGTNYTDKNSYTEQS